MKNNSLSIDGLTGSGKTAVGLLLAEALGYFYLEPYTLAEAVLTALLRTQVDFSKHAAILREIQTTQLTLIRRKGARRAFVQRRAMLKAHFYKIIRQQPWQLLVNGEPVIPRVELPRALPGFAVTWKFFEWLTLDAELHAALGEHANHLAQHHNLIVTGDFLSPANLPNAPHKYLLTAEVWSRAIRLTEQSRERGAIADRNDEYQTVLRSDAKYAQRPTHPRRLGRSKPKGKPSYRWRTISIPKSFSNGQLQPNIKPSFRIAGMRLP